MTRKKFRFFLQPDANNYYNVQGSVVGISSTATPLVFDPIGWKDLQLAWVRNVKYHGIFRSYVLPLTLVKDGATILRYVFYTQEGIESKCIFRIEKMNSTNDLYEPYYSGEIDFSQAHDTRNTFQVAVLDMGLAAILKANDSTPYEIPVFGYDSLNVLLDGLRLKNTTTITLANDFTATNTWHQMMPTMRIQTSESDIQVDIVEQLNQLGLGTAALLTGYPFFKATINGTVEIDYDISMLVGNSAGSSLSTYSFEMRITRMSSGIPTVYTLYLNANPSLYIGHTLPATGTVSIPVLAGDTLIYYAGLNPFSISGGGVAPVVDHTYNYSTLKVHYDLQLPSSVVRAYRYNQLFEKLIAKFTNGAYGVHSDFLTNQTLVTADNKPWNTLSLSGDGLRRQGLLTGFWSSLNFLTSENIKTTLQDLHNDASFRWMTGIGVENSANGNQIVRLEHQSHFYQNTVIISLEEVVGFETDIADQYFYNLLKIGYHPNDYDRLNGKDEPNNTAVYALPIIRKKAELDMVSPYRCDMYGVEFTRSLLLNKETTDSESDSDTFLLEVEDSPAPVTLTAPAPSYSGYAYHLKRQQNDLGNSATGLIAADKAFNLSLSPARNLQRNGAMLHSFLYQQEAKTITFQTADKNADLVSNLGSGAVGERDNIQVSTLPPPLYLPLTFLFDTAVPENVPDLVEANPYGLVSFKWRNPASGELLTLSGFISEIRIRSEDNGICQWKLLAAPDTIISQLCF